MAAKRIVRRKLDPFSLYTKCCIDCILAALAIWAATTVGFKLDFRTECKACDPGCSNTNTSLHCKHSLALCNPEGTDDSVYASFGAECETLNAFRAAVLSGGLLLLLPKILVAIELTWVVRKAYLEDRVIFYTKSRDELFAEMFSEIPLEFRGYDGFVVRLGLAPLNLLLFIFPFLKCGCSKPITPNRAPKRGELVKQYALSLPSLCLPFSLMFLLSVLVREARNPIECFFYSAALQIYAFLGSLIANEIFNREASIGALLKSSTLDTALQDHVFTILTSELLAAARTQNATVEVSPKDLREVEVAEMIAELLKYVKFEGNWTLRFRGFNANEAAFFSVLKKIHNYSDVTFVFDRDTRFSDDELDSPLRITFDNE